MIRISQLKLPVTHKKSDLEKKIYTTLKISSSDLLTWHIEKNLWMPERNQIFFMFTRLQQTFRMKSGSLKRTGIKILQ